MEMWLKIRHGEIVLMYQVEKIVEHDGEIRYSTKDHGTIYHTVDNIYILDVGIGIPNEVSIVLTA